LLVRGALRELCRDADAACVDEEKLNVELACSTALAPAYHPEFLAKLLPDAKTIVFIVCGGFKISVQELAGYFSKVDDVTPWEVWCDGETWSVTPTQHGQ
jgi:L-serine/L-threonine ammonia-lyase